MSNGMVKLRMGDFNVMNVNHISAVEVEITLYKRGKKTLNKIRVRNLSRKDQEILSDKEVPAISHEMDA